jgi:hypothetical protein
VRSFECVIEVSSLLDPHSVVLFLGTWRGEQSFSVDICWPGRALLATDDAQAALTAFQQEAFPEFLGTLNLSIGGDGMSLAVREEAARNDDADFLPFATKCLTLRVRGTVDDAAEAWHKSACAQIPILHESGGGGGGGVAGQLFLAGRHQRHRLSLTSASSFFSEKMTVYAVPPVRDGNPQGTSQEDASETDAGTLNLYATLSEDSAQQLVSGHNPLAEQAIHAWMFNLTAAEAKQFFSSPTQPQNSFAV